MKKPFHLSHSQAAGALVLIALLVLCVFISQHTSEYDNDTHNLQLEEFKARVSTFEKSLQSTEKTPHTTYNDPTLQNSNQETTWEDYQLSYFDPNTADSLQLMQLGLSNWVVGNILHYRAAGGTFRTSQQFSRIYRLTPTKYEELKPYIQLKKVQDKALQPSSHLYISSVKRDTILELNTADTTSLQLIRGIGSGYARAIIRRRTELGGYHSVEQLSEIALLSDSTYRAIKASFIVDPSRIQRIDANRATIDRLRRHPYLNYYQARGIYEMRRLKFSLDSLEQLYQVYELDSTTIERIRPYLSFD